MYDFKDAVSASRLTMAVQHNTEHLDGDFFEAVAVQHVSIGNGKTYGLELGDDVKLSMTEELVYQATPVLLCPAVERLCDKFKARGFKRITVRWVG